MDIRFSVICYAAGLLHFQDAAREGRPIATRLYSALISSQYLENSSKKYWIFSVILGALNQGHQAKTWERNSLCREERRKKGKIKAWKNKKRIRAKEMDFGR